MREPQNQETDDIFPQEMAVFQTTKKVLEAELRQFVWKIRPHLRPSGAARGGARRLKKKAGKGSLAT